MILVSAASVAHRVADIFIFVWGESKSDKVLQPCSNFFVLCCALSDNTLLFHLLNRKNSKITDQGENMREYKQAAKIFLNLIAVCGFFIGGSEVFAQLNCTNLNTGVTYTEAFDGNGPTNLAIPPATTGTTLPPGFNSTDPDGIYAVNNGSSATGNTYSYGSTVIGANEQERAFGSLVSGITGTIYYGFCFTNNTGAVINDITVQYVGEQWRSANTNPQSLTFDYRTQVTVADTLTTGTFTAVPALTFTSPNTSDVGAIDGNAIANIATLTAQINFATPVQVGESFILRWTDIDDTGSDHGLAIDSVRVDPGLVTAGEVTINGRVLDSKGRGLSYVRVLLTGGNLTEPKYATTNNFGYYSFAELDAGETYVVSAISKRYNFREPSKVVSLNQSLTDIDFIGVSRR